MKKYYFELVIREGDDEFWEGLKGKIGVTDVEKLIKDGLITQGLYEDYDYDLKLKKFKE